MTSLTLLCYSVRKGGAYRQTRDLILIDLSNGMDPTIDDTLCLDGCGE